MSNSGLIKHLEEADTQEMDLYRGILLMQLIDKLKSGEELTKDDIDLIVYYHGDEIKRD